MTYIFSSNFNQFFQDCLNQFNDSKKNYLKQITKLNKLINPLSLSFLNSEIFSETSSICAKLGSYISTIRSFSSYSIVEVKRVSNFLEYFNKMFTNRYFRDSEGLELLQIHLRGLNELPEYFTFDKQKIMELYKKYVGDSIKSNVAEMIMKDWRFWVSLIGSIISLIVIILKIIHDIYF